MTKVNRPEASWSAMELEAVASFLIDLQLLSNLTEITVNLRDVSYVHEVSSFVIR